jgi:signal transduction histidine kinase
MDEGDLLQLSIYATEFHRSSKRFLLVSIQDIGSELEEKELEAWQNLIRVLTHEIRNTITPIASLANTTRELLGQIEETASSEEDGVADARLAAETIYNRSQGLMNFVEAFRSLYKIPKPSYTRFDMGDFMEHMQNFFQHKFDEQNVDVRFSCSPASFIVTADRDLIEQVMINLLTNALQAVEGQEDAKVQIAARIDSRGRARVSISDNGPGISEEDWAKVFIPFYTTKSDGTGIGLSLSRQILRMHKGTISVQSKPGDTTFQIQF